MKIVLWLLLCLALPVAASANSVDFTNSGGTLSGSTAGLSLSGSTFIAINAGTLLTGDLGTITFSTGALTSTTRESRANNIKPSCKFDIN